MHGERDDGRDGNGSAAEREPEIPTGTQPKHGGRRLGAGRKAVHSLSRLRRTVTALTTRRLDGRSAVAVAVRKWKADVTADLGGDLSRAQDTILESAAQAWVILSSLDAWIARQPTLVTKKRQLLPVVLQRMQIAEGLARNLERLGLERRAKQVQTLHDYLAAKASETPARPSRPSAPSAALSGGAVSADGCRTPPSEEPTQPSVGATAEGGSR